MAAIEKRDALLRVTLANIYNIWGRGLEAERKTKVYYTQYKPSLQLRITYVQHKYTTYN